MQKRVRASMVCIYNGSILVFKGVDPTTQKQYWFLPGGQIENGETPWQCAERETLEETGYKVKADPKTELQKNYRFAWDGVQYDCTTYFYKGALIEKFAPPKPVVDVAYNKGASWVPISEIGLNFSYTDEIKSAILTLVTSG